jgi:hypothetical protein
MPIRLINIPILLIGLAPTLISLFAAGILIGRPRVCNKGVCVPYRAEVLLLPLGTGVPLLCGYLLGLGGNPKPSKRRSNAVLSELNSQGTIDSDPVEVGGVREQ